MKYKKVMALLLSAGLSATSLSSCSLIPQTAFGMETEADTKAEEGNSDGTEENTQDPASEKETVSPEEAAPEKGENTAPEEAVQAASDGNDGTAQADAEAGALMEQIAASEDGGGTAQEPADKGGPSSGQEEVPPAQENPSDGSSGSQEETQGQTDVGDQGNGQAESGEHGGVTDTDGSGSSDQGSNTGSETQAEPQTENGSEALDQEAQTEAGTETGAETGAGAGISEESEGSSTEETQSEESELESETEGEGDPDEMDDLDNSDGYGGAYFSGGSYWDKSWYFKRDFRFTQVEKVYGIANASRLARIYEAPDVSSGIVGEIPYFGLAYVLDEKDGFYYIESGDARGFIQKSDLTIGDYADETVDLLGESSFEEGAADVEIPDNAAFTYTKTTTQDVISDKDYAITYMAGSILEYPKDGARTIGELANGTLVYVLEDTGDGWLYVESGDVRGFVRAELLLTGEGAKAVTEDMGEGTISLAEEVISPEENRSLYYTLASVKPAVDQMGESLCEYALSFAGKLPYVYGGTSLGFGADCSGFTQSIFSCFGISIPRTAQDQGASGQAIDSLSNARPGDIIYYGSGPHVGIYLGDGKVIQCSGNESNTASNPGKGPMISAVDYMPITAIRRYIIETDGDVPGISGEGNRRDGSVYSQKQLELIWAIVAQEDNGSYEGALAVISSAMNRTESERWGYCGGDALTQLTAPGQYCYSLDDYWKPRLGGNVPEYVKQAVNDCLVKGIRNHNHTSFRSTKEKTTGNDAVQIGGNWYFGT